QHALAVRALAFAADSKTLWSSSEDRTALRWDLEAEKSVATLTTGQGNHPVAALTYAPDGKTFAIATGDRVQLRDAKTGAVLHRLDGHASPKRWGRGRCVAFAPGGHVLASGGEDPNLLPWDVNTGTAQRGAAGHQSPV